MTFFKILFLLLFVKPSFPINNLSGPSFALYQSGLNSELSVPAPPVPDLKTKPTSLKQINSHISGLKNTKNQRSDSRAISLYNLAVSELSLDKKDTALLFFERAFYNYLFFPAFKALKFMESPVTFIPLIWHFIMGFYAISSLFLIWFLIAKKTSLKTRIKAFAFWSILLAALGAFSTFGLKSKGRSLKSFELKNAPLKGAFLIATYKKGEPFVALKSKGIWVKIKTNQNQKGWTLRENLYFTQD